MTAVEAPPSAATADEGAVERTSVADVLRGNLDLVVYPLVVVVGLLVAFVAVYAQPLDEIAQRIIDPQAITTDLTRHLLLTVVSTIVVLVVAIPLGIALSRPWARRLQGPVLAVGGFGQALPPFGLIVLLAFIFGFGVPTAVFALALAAFLPVLRNTVVGLQQVDGSLIEAARGMGMSARQTLFSVEIPLAVPVIVAGLRVALVLNVGTAALATYIGAGGLGNIVDQALKLSRFPSLVIGASLIAALALLVDWLAGVAERVIVARAG